MLHRLRALMFVPILLLTACAIPMPPEKAAYVGEWKAPGMSLLILADGSIVYEPRRRNDQDQRSAQGLQGR